MPMPATPALLADGDILTAAWLNQLSACVSFLGGVAGAPNPGFPAWHTTSDADSVRYYHIRHSGRYLHVRAVPTGGCDYVKVYYNGVQVLNDGSPSVPVTYHIDLNPFGFTLGSLYPVQINTHFSGSGSFDLQIFWENDDATGGIS